MTEMQSGNPTDDTEGHRRMTAEAEATEGDDIEGHRRMTADAESAEGDDDTEGHVYVQEPGAPGAKTVR